MAVPIDTAQSLTLGLPATLFEARAGRTSELTWEYVPSADGQRFLFKELVFGETGSPMVVVLNWRTLLGR